MNKYKLLVSYDGTRYVGWQEQKNQPSVCYALRKAFSKVFNKNITIVGASRTDAGVHAFGQVALCKTDLKIDPHTMHFAWNNTLPQDIHIRSVSLADSAFHPHHNIEKKVYYYHIFPRRPLPFFARFGLYYPMKLDPAYLQSALEMFIGTHDFKQFSTEEVRTDTVRTVDDIQLEYLERFGVYRITVVGQKFLRHMIRRMVGAALALSTRDELDKDIIAQLLAGKACEYSLPSAPACGLMLKRIIFAE